MTSTEYGVFKNESLDKIGHLEGRTTELSEQNEFLKHANSELDKKNAELLQGLNDFKQLKEKKNLMDTMVKA